MKKLYFLLLLFIYSFVNAQWTSDASANTTVTTSNYCTNDPIIIHDGQGGVIISWLDDRNSVDNYTDIYAQKLNSQGYPQWTTNGVPICVKPGIQEFGSPSQRSNQNIISDGAGGAIITWVDYNYNSMTTTYPQIFAQRINAAGNTLWTQNGVMILNSGPVQLGFATYPNIASDENGGAIITWADLRNFNSFNQMQIFAQKINSSGTVEWITNGIQINTTLGSKPKITSDGEGGAIIAWQDVRLINENDNSDTISIFAQHINSSGNFLWPIDGVPIFPQYSNPNVVSGDMEMIADELSGSITGAIIVAKDDRNFTEYHNYYAQKINSSGNLLWGQGGITVCDAVNQQNDIRLISDKLNGAIFTWTDNRDDPDGDIYSQRINSLGLPLWGNNGLLLCDGGDSLSNTNSQSNPNITSDGSNGAIITWGDGRGTGDLYIQKVTSNSIIMWDLNGVVICNNNSEQYVSKIVSDLNGGAISVWSDGRDLPGGSNIYAQNICSNGQLGGNCALGVDKNNITKFTLSPNPTHTILNLQVPTNTTIDKIIITDLLGKIIKEDTQNTTVINVENLSNGLYILQAYSNGQKMETKFVKQ